jgi:SWI/SNF-related matrix-associated actin-dependent regulator 1 of chromatin subfamily A
MMKIVAEKTQNHRFALYYDYSQDRVDFCRSLKESFGWRQFAYEAEGDSRRWVFTDSLFVPILAERFPEVQVEPIVGDLVEQEQKWTNEARRREKRVDVVREKVDTDFQVTGIKGDLYTYQKIGVEFLLESGGRAIIADGMGLGKTLQALAFVTHQGYKRVLVVCPASVKFSWRDEIKKWTKLSSVIIDSKTDLSSINPDINLWIINYDILKKHFAQLSKIRFDALIGDECQLIKTTGAIRTKAFRSISRYIPSVILLSGTPLLSRPSELFSLLNIIDAKTWNNWYEFARRYCAMHQTRWGMDTSGASNVEELHNRIRRYFIRRDKMDVLKELPPKTFIDVPVELDRDTKKKYNTAANDLATYLRQYAGKQPPAIAQSMAAEKLTRLNVLRQLSAMGKVPAAIELVDSIVDAGEKVLVFSSFVEPLKKLAEHLGEKAVMITGQTQVDARGDIVNTFQTDKEVPVFLGGIKSAGVGITLTAASNVIFLDYSWNPADHHQAQDRVHRPGQKADNINIYQLVVPGTIDDDLKEILSEKQDIFDQVIEGRVVEKVSKQAMDKATIRILNDY